MCSDVSIEVSGVGKVFPVYSRPHHRFFQMMSPPARKRRWYREFRALKEINFSVKQGETVGIIGRNGSGKSTLLQIICGTLSPSSGHVQAHGRIAALLELGAGFNPEFTGRENIYMNGALLGLSREEINARFEQITAFADIGEFIEQPVKSYSSGMFVRLAFAVAIHVEPDILIVDEALSVGDEAFQRKCFARIEQLRERGATIIFVSHSASTVLELCNRAILLDHGELLSIGEPKEIVARYQKLLYAPQDKAAAIREEYLAERRATKADFESGLLERGAPGDGAGNSFVEDDRVYLDSGLISQSAFRYQSQGAHISDPHIETLSGRRVNVLKPGDEYVYTYEVSFDKPATMVRFGMLIKTVSGVELGGAVTTTVSDALALVEAGSRFRIRFQFKALFTQGVYFMNAGVTGSLEEGEVFLDRIVDALAFRIPPDLGRLTTGFVDFCIKPSTQLLRG